MCGGAPSMLWLVSPLWPPLFISAVLGVLGVLGVLVCSRVRSVSAALGEVEDVPAGLKEALLLFEVHLQNPLHQHEGHAALRDATHSDDVITVQRDMESDQHCL